MEKFKVTDEMVLELLNHSGPSVYLSTTDIYDKLSTQHVEHVRNGGSGFMPTRRSVLARLRKLSGKQLVVRTGYSDKGGYDWALTVKGAMHLGEGKE